MSEIHDVIIVGAGPAGSAIAYFLASNGLDVQLLDKSDFPRDKTCGDGLSPRALSVLQKMGLFESVRSAGFETRRVAFFAPNGNQVITPIPVYGNLPNFAMVVPRFTFDDLLRNHAVAAGANFHAQVNVVDVLRDAGSITGVRANTINGPIELNARVTILATGGAYALLERAQLLKHRPDFCRAARAYYEGVDGLSDILEIHYDSIPLPGYGWIFPTSATSANIGAGYYLPLGRSDKKNSPRTALDEFISAPRISEMLINAQISSPIKGYLLRFDFPESQIAFPGLVLVGEACGLVNPLTGEGIDYALESAELAAEILIKAVQHNEPLDATMHKYSNAFHERFLATYKSLIRVRDLYMRPWMMNRYVSTASHNNELALLLANIGFGNIDPLKAFSLKNLLQIALG